MGTTVKGARFSRDTDRGWLRRTVHERDGALLPVHGLQERWSEVRCGGVRSTRRAFPVLAASTEADPYHNTSKRQGVLPGVPTDRLSSHSPCRVEGFFVTEATTR